MLKDLNQNNLNDDRNWLQQRIKRVYLMLLLKLTSPVCPSADIFSYSIFYVILATLGHV